jgi:hypothetical protein
MGAGEKPSSGDGKRVIAAAVITGVLGLIGTIAAAVIGHQAGASEAKPGPTETITETVTAQGSSGGSGSTIIGNPTPAPAKGTQLRSGTFILTAGHCIDLDSKAPNWGVTDCFTDSTSADIENYNVALVAPNSNNGNAIAPLSSSQSSSLATCKSVTNYVDTIDLGDLSNGLRMCVHTASGNDALLQIKNISYDAGNNTIISFAAIVWEG